MLARVAVYTELPLAEAERIARAHGLGGVRAVHGVLAGSVNSNFFIDTDVRRVFARIYEEQDADGVRYELALLDHLRRAGLPVPERVPGPTLRVAGKPVVLFELLGGDEVCQRLVDADRARSVGVILATAHRALADFPERREGRFTRADVRARIERVAALDRAELRGALQILGETLDEVDAAPTDELPRGVIHGDLFRDNLRWDGGRVVGVLDWESASDGLFVYDLAVTVLAWCFDDRLRWDLASALVQGYESVRGLAATECAFVRTALLAAAARFTVTRITDYHLREGSAQVKKDWRRFFARLEEVRALDVRVVRERLGLG
jgi:homoserine kinase type II